MVFGRKKDQEHEGVEIEEKALNMDQDQDQDLALAYGNEDEVNDDMSAADSIPPPPPAGDVIETKKEDDSRTLEESPSIGANENFEGSIDEKKEAELIKRKKLLLIAGCIISFFILLGLSIKYGKSRNRSGVNAILANGAEESSLSAPIPDSEPEPVSASSNVVDENDATQDIAFTNNTTTTTGTAFLDPETSAPSVSSSTEGTSIVSSDGSSAFADCVANEVSVSTTCNNNGFASASMSFCLVDDLSDQFWEWVNTPPGTALGLANRWGYLRDNAEAEIPFLPEGTYEVGIYSSGDLMLNQYPLITSFQFIVSCRL
jgi:hypothetical protein